MNNIFFTGDTHFKHGNIIKYCNRPFSSLEEHDETLIQNWNNVVKKEDIVYHLGDFCFRDFNDYFYRLNGQIHFIEGNHDKETHKHRDKFASYSKYKEIGVGDQKIVLCHYAFRIWNKSHYGSWNLYGHSHGSLSDDPHARAIDVGVDCHNYTPIEYEQVKEIMFKKLWQPIDHHGQREESGDVGLPKEDYEKLDRKRLYLQLKKEFE